MENNNHDEIMRSLGRLEAGQDAIIERLNKVNGRLDKHDEKISSLETFQTTVKVKTGVVASLVGGGIAFMGFIINKYF